MTQVNPTNGERLARIEAILDESVVPALDKLTDAVQKDVADLARLKNRGAGILVGVSVAFTALGAFLQAKFNAFIGLFN